MLADVPVATDAPADNAAAEGEYIAAGDDAPLPPPPPFEVGIFDDMLAEIYHRHEAMSSGGVKKILKSCAHYRLMRTTRNIPTPAMQFGSAVHDGVLEPETFDARVVVRPDFGHPNSNAAKAAKAAFVAANAGRIILSPADMVRARRTIDAVWEHPAARKLLTGAEIEKSFFWNDARYKVPCKARWDARNYGFAIDLKTTEDASPDGFARSIANYGYHAQGAHYCSAAEHLLNASPEGFLFIAAESVPPHAVAVYQLPGNAIAAGMRLVNIALARYADALAAGTWAGYPNTIESIQLPQWALRIAA